MRSFAKTAQDDRLIKSRQNDKLVILSIREGSLTGTVLIPASSLNHQGGIVVFTSPEPGLIKEPLNKSG